VVLALTAGFLGTTFVLDTLLAAFAVGLASTCFLANSLVTTLEGATLEGTALASIFGAALATFLSSPFGFSFYDSKATNSLACSKLKDKSTLQPFICTANLSWPSLPGDAAKDSTTQGTAANTGASGASTKPASALTFLASAKTCGILKKSCCNTCTGAP
jgi:hypothetical protein